MAKIPFQVNARMARLIGRENVATADGAITELVKNAYDADAHCCSIIFVERYKTTPEKLTFHEYSALKGLFPKVAELYEVDKENGFYLLSDNQDPKLLEQFTKTLHEILDIWIVDNGSGMTQKTIEENWMVIGTTNKAENIVSKGGRRVNGAKGIGRFALDRLGRQCDLFTVSDMQNPLVNWRVNWEDFDASGKKLNEIFADLDEINISLRDLLGNQEILDLLPKTYPAKNGEVNKAIDYSLGSAIKISLANDFWSYKAVNELMSTLEVLIPAQEQSSFNVFLLDTRTLDAGGWVGQTLPNDFDYHLAAEVCDDGLVKIKIDRKEIDFQLIRKSVFSLNDMDRNGFRIDDLRNGTRQYETSLRELFKVGENDNIDDLLSIGPFSLDLYYFKLANPTRTVLQKYPQKKFNVKKRKDWFERSGGIRLYRDDFRVRPYGEPNSFSFDWLQLGRRVAMNPAAVSRRGQWQVPPHQLAGTLRISHEENLSLADRSNREGIADDASFSIFREIIIRLIEEFEFDRSYLYSCFELAYKKDNPKEEIKKKGKAAAAKINKNKGNVTETSDAKDVADALTESEAEKKELIEENKLLRGMATLGTVLVSFTHELKQLKVNVEKRNSRMISALSGLVDEEKLEKTGDHANPYMMLDRWKVEDDKIAHWIDFALSAVTPDKQEKTEVNLFDYFNELKSRWSHYLVSKGVAFDLNMQIEKDLSILIHEVELDSIFYNLIVNSIEAFLLVGSPKDRKIVLSVELLPDNLIAFTYSDSGPGLGDYYNHPSDIFAFGVTSKFSKDKKKKMGTGLGMWILKAIVDDMDGEANLIINQGQGFGINILLPVN